MQKNKSRSISPAAGQDPLDTVVPATFKYRTFAEFPKEQKYNMDEVGSDTNKGRKKKVCGTEQLNAAMKRASEETDGDNNPFHVTNMLTTRADGRLCIPPVLIHSNPSTTSKTAQPKLTTR